MSHHESSRVIKSHQESSRVIKSHQESSRVTKSHKRVKVSRASRLIQVERSNALINFSVLYQDFFKAFFKRIKRIKRYKRVKASRASRLIQVERSNALINFSVLYQAFFKRFSSVLCFATSKRQALVLFVWTQLIQKHNFTFNVSV